MDEIFAYEWHELTKGRRLTVKLVLQAVILAVIAGIGPELLFLATGHGSVASMYELKFMMVAIPVIIGVSVISYRNSPVTDITTSSLLVDGDAVKVTRHVISETGRHFFATWDSLEVYAYRVDELHRVIQVDAKWKVSAFRMKGRKPGRFVDSDVRSHPQTFQMAPEAFYSLSAHLKEKCPDIVSVMTPGEYERAKPFIHKHYEI